MAVLCDFCGEEITEARIEVPQPPPTPSTDPTTPPPTIEQPRMFHMGCSDAWWENAKQLKGKRPKPNGKSITPPAGGTA